MMGFILSISTVAFVCLTSSTSVHSQLEYDLEYDLPDLGSAAAYKPVLRQKGEKGDRGEKGMKGPPGVTPMLLMNWKQCTKTEGTARSKGSLLGCFFKKHRFDTSLHVEFGGTLRATHLGSGSNLNEYSTYSICVRWYFTFDGKECEPPIDGVVFESERSNSHRPHQIGGFCQATMEDTAIKSGWVNIRFNIGECHHGSRKLQGIPYLGLDSVSRITITEVPQPQQPYPGFEDGM
ncbi:collagen triple helix repeat-containing protein 1-like [Corticium candelabrum]|uniref:collagen triple helix repeat-containing protein 1-like n=1 Tax=Corticium candelabrum TaxID=121492 RepID=UPI002E26E2D1|nr:collagen triple helix repeat-containing protein 1-like [Corticium candelabrum]